MSATESWVLAPPAAIAVAPLTRIVNGVSALIAAAALAVGFAALLNNDAEVLALPVLALVLLSALANAGVTWRDRRTIDIHALMVAGLSAVGVLLLLVLPEYMYGREINGIIHRSLVASVWLFLAGIPAAVLSINRLLGATPTAQDRSRYPIILLPVALVAVVYGLLLAKLVADGAGDLSWNLITTSYTERLGETEFVYQAGLRNHILGTLLLIAMTSLIAIGPGVGAGVFVSEFRNPLVPIVRFSTTMLRAISVFIIGVAAFSLVDVASGYATGDPISDFIRGYYTDANGFKHAAKGSFLTASLFLSLLVIPVIARSTEEGLRSVPRDIREGSVAIGATHGHTLLRILLPWAAPNIITGLLLGAAEAAGSVAVLLLIAGTGQYGVGPLNEVTSLAFAIFGTKYGPKPFQDTMGQYDFTAALILMTITLGLTVGALLVKQRFAARYRGSLTSE